MRLAFALLLAFAAPYYIEVIRVGDELFRGIALVGYLLLIAYLVATWVRKNS